MNDSLTASVYISGFLYQGRSNKGEPVTLVGIMGAADLVPGQPPPIIVDPPRPPGIIFGKPPPPQGGWGYHPVYGWGYFPMNGGKPNPPGVRDEPPDDPPEDIMVGKP